MPKRAYGMPKFYKPPKALKSDRAHKQHLVNSPFSSRNLWQYKTKSHLQLSYSNRIVPTTKQSGSILQLQKVAHDTYDFIGVNQAAVLNCTCHTNQVSVNIATREKTPNDSKSKGKQLIHREPDESMVICLSEANSSTNIRLPRSVISVTGDQMARFLALLEQPVIKKFMHFDVCLRTTDKYLLAMAFAYFARAKLPSDEYTTLNLFVALYLAHDVEEDEEEYKYEIFPWALGKLWRTKYKTILNLREKMWKRMGYRAIVSRKCCEEIMSIEPEHTVWNRERKQHHAGAIRPWLKEPHDDGKLIGPNGSPRHCNWCNYPPKSHERTDSDHDSLSPENDHLWLQLDSSASSVEEFAAANITSSSAAPGFSMNELQMTLLHSSGKTNSSGKGKSLVSGDTTLDWIDCSSDININNSFRQPEV